VIAGPVAGLPAAPELPAPALEIPPPVVVIPAPLPPEALPALAESPAGSDDLLQALALTKIAARTIAHRAEVDTACI
jgi:hypothetical protein